MVILSNGHIAKWQMAIWSKGKIGEWFSTALKPPPGNDQDCQHKNNSQENGLSIIGSMYKYSCNIIFFSLNLSVFDMLCISYRLNLSAGWIYRSIEISYRNLWIVPSNRNETVQIVLKTVYTVQYTPLKVGRTKEIQIYILIKHTVKHTYLFWKTNFQLFSRQHKCMRILLINNNASTSKLTKPFTDCGDEDFSSMLDHILKSLFKKQSFDILRMSCTVAHFLLQFCFRCRNPGHMYEYKIHTVG